jgi:hypothetical protein
VILKCLSQSLQALIASSLQGGSPPEVDFDKFTLLGSRRLLPHCHECIPGILCLGVWIARNFVPMIDVHRDDLGGLRKWDTWQYVLAEGEQRDCAI